MLRYVVIILLAVCIAGGVAYSGGWLDDFLGIEKSTLNNGSSADPSKPAVDIGDLLYPAAAMPAIPKAQQRSTEQIVIDAGHVVPRDKQDISSPKDGHLLFIGLEITELNQNKLDLTRPLKQVEVYTGKEKKKFYYQPWEDGLYVDFDQVVAKIEPSLAIQEVYSKAVDIIAAQADSVATNAILKEARAKWGRLKELRAQRGPTVVTDEELGAAEATVMKYIGESVKNEKAIEKAEVAKWQADIVLFTYDLRSKIEGKSIVKKKYKANGEGIKSQEPILQLFGIDRLKIEGSVDSQYLASLRRHRAVTCYLEPSEEMAHYELQKSHRGEVTCVGFCSDGWQFVSGSEDKTVCVWKRGLPAPVQTLEHSAPVRSVACSPKGMWLLVGCADGSISLWDLTRPTQPVKVIKDQHRGPVTALAFSPDASYFASGGEDNAITLYKADGEVLYPFDSEYGVDDAHQGTITSIYFTPQCKLVSAARDNTLRVWELHQKGAKPSHAPITNRGGTVNNLGVSADGAYMLFDKGKTIQLLNTADGSTVCTLDNLAGSNPFDTLAIFSPDGTLMLTGGAGEGRLQLWKKPTPDERAYQVRELVAKDRSAITRAAFAPANPGQPGQQRYAVSGSKEGHVHLWALPDNDTVNNHRILVDAEGKPLTIWVEEAIEGGKTRISVNVLNPQSSPGNYRLLPGKRVTIVVNLPQAK